MNRRPPERRVSLPEPESNSRPAVANQHRVNLMQKKLLAVAMAVAGLSLSSVSMAGPGGTAGPTSSQNSILTLQINGAIIINQVADINLGIFDPTVVADVIGTSQACVGRAGGTDYSVTVTSANTSFNLVDPLTVTPIPYQVAWRDNSAEAYTTLSYGVASGTYTADQASVGPCGGETDNKLQVTVPYAGMNASTAGIYQDTLTVLVAPL